jgi:hypothetical protein
LSFGPPFPWFSIPFILHLWTTEVDLSVLMVTLGTSKGDTKPQDLFKTSDPRRVSVGRLAARKQEWVDETTHPKWGPRLGDVHSGAGRMQQSR